TPAPPATSAAVRAPWPPEADVSKLVLAPAAGVVEGTTAAGCATAASGSSSGTEMLAVCPPAATVTLPDHFFLPSADAVTECGPGSTGTGEPQRADPTTIPSRSTFSPLDDLAAGATSITILDSVGSSAAARARAVFSRASLRCAAISAASRK